MNEVEFSRVSEISLTKMFDAAEEVASHRGFSRIAIPKRRGGKRHVLKPTPSVEAVLTAMNVGLGAVYAAPAAVHGYVRGRSTISNAAQHLAKPVVLCIDLRDFFPSISSGRIVAALNSLGFESGLTSLVERLTCVDGALPAGFPTSPILSNVVFESTDLVLESFALANGLDYTRYADDMTFSGRVITDSTLEAIESILLDEGWTLNHEKTRFMRVGGPQYVTGLYVGLPDRPRVPRRMKKLLRMQLYYLGKYGYRDCHLRSPRTFGHKKVLGWVHYLRQLEPELAASFDELAAGVDFDLPTRIGFDDEWDALLSDLGVSDELK
jgi:RNA-directed DNA polymerase